MCMGGTITLALLTSEDFVNGCRRSVKRSSSVLIDFISSGYIWDGSENSRRFRLYANLPSTAEKLLLNDWRVILIVTTLSPPFRKQHANFTQTNGSIQF